MAGSVMPKQADTPEAEARARSFSSRVVIATAKVAAPCATLATDAVAKMKEPPVAKSCSSTGGKDW